MWVHSVCQMNYFNIAFEYLCTFFCHGVVSFSKSLSIRLIVYLSSFYHLNKKFIGYQHYISCFVELLLMFWFPKRKYDMVYDLCNKDIYLDMYVLLTVLSFFLFPLIQCWRKSDAKCRFKEIIIQLYFWHTFYFVFKVEKNIN